MRKIPALGRSTHLRKLSELYLGQKYDYPVVSTRKCLDIVLRGTNYNWKIKPRKGNAKRPGSKIYDGNTYVKARVLRSMKETPFRVVVEFTPWWEISESFLERKAVEGWGEKYFFRLKPITSDSISFSDERISWFRRLSGNRLENLPPNIFQGLFALEEL